MTTFAGWLHGQNVNVNSTGGTPFASYATLNAAFTAINGGVHTGQILVSLVASTSEGATSAVLNASGTGAASYTKVYIAPTVSGVTVSGTPASGAAVIQLAGADNVTINGAVGASGSVRSLTIENNTASGTANTAAIWVRSAGTGLGAINDTIMNCIIRGNDATNTAAASTFGIYAAGATISSTGTGADNDNLRIINNEIGRAWVGIYARGTAAGVLNNLEIRGNNLGNATPALSIGRNGIDIQQATSALVTLNDIGPWTTASTTLIFGVELGTGTTSCRLTRNTVHDLNNTGSSGAWGLNVASGTGNIVDNNFIHGIRNQANSTASTTTLAAGIRINGGTNHQIYYNSVNLYGTTTHAGATHSAALVITTTAATGLNIRNNIFSNSCNHPIAGSKAYAVLTSATYNWTTATSTINYNAYYVPATSTATTAYHIGSPLSSGDYTDLAAFRTWTAQDANSFPYVNQTPPFVSNSNLHVTSFPVLLESAGIAIAGFDNDYDNEVRQGSVGYSHVPAGTAPDIGADEIASTPGDFSPPSISGVSVTPGSQCTPVAHTVQATVTDGSTIASVVILWWLDGVAQPDITMAPVGGGVYSGVIPASGSAVVQWQVKATDGATPVANFSVSGVSSYRDAYLGPEAGATDSVCIGESYLLSGSHSHISTIKITEIAQFSTGTGATAPYPSWLPATGIEDYIEIGNVGPVAVNIGGFRVDVVGITTRNFTFPAGTVLPAGAVAVLHIGTGTDDPANRLWNMGGANNVVQSGSLTGYYIKNAGGQVVDAVATNGYSFNVAATGVTSSDWSGAIASSSGRAGVIRTVTDNNVAADWVVANNPTPLQTFGTMNPGLSAALPTATWDGGATSGTALITPVASGWHYFTVTDGVCTATDSMFLEVLALPSVPTVPNDTICGTDTLSFTASGGISYNWYDAPSGGALLATGATFGIEMSSTDTFYVSATNGACESARVMVIGVVTTADSATGALSTSVACEFEPVTLTGTSANPSYSYTWSGPDLPSTTGNPVSITAFNSGDYFMEAIDSAGCRVIQTLHLDVNYVGESSITGGPSTVCPGSSATLVGSFSPDYVTGNTAFVSRPALTVTDNFLPGVKDTITVAGVYPGPMVDSLLVEVCLDTINMTWDGDLNVFLFTPCGDTIELTTGNGGSADNYIGTCFTATAAASITTGAAPFSGTWLPEDAAVFGEITGCQPNGNWVLWLFDNATGDVANVVQWHLTINSITHYSAGHWTSTSGLSVTADTLVDAPAATTVYYYTVTDTLTGCTAVDSFTVRVPDPIVASASGPAIACTGSTVTLSVTATGGTGGYTYDWAGLGTNDSLEVVVTSDTLIVVTVSDTCGTSSTDSILVLMATPVGGIIVADSAVCAGDSAMLMVAPTGGDGAYNYAWSTGGTSSMEYVTPSVAGTYSVTVTDGCGSTYIDSVTVGIIPATVADFTFPAPAFEGVPVNFTNTSTGATSYTWDFGGLGTSTLANPTFTFPSGAGIVNVTMIASGPCGNDTVTYTVDVLVGTMSALGSGAFGVHPNPSSGEFNLAFSNLSGEAHLLVTDLRGVMLAEQQINLISQHQGAVLDLSSLPNGVYLLRIATDAGVATTKLVKQ